VLWCLLPYCLPALRLNYPLPRYLSALLPGFLTVLLPGCLTASLSYCSTTYFYTAYCSSASMPSCLTAYFPTASTTSLPYSPSAPLPNCLAALMHHCCWNHWPSSSVPQWQVNLPPPPRVSILCSVPHCFYHLTKTYSLVFVRKKTYFSWNEKLVA
jgi:hypothetical protein